MLHKQVYYSVNAQGFDHVDEETQILESSVYDDDWSL